MLPALSVVREDFRQVPDFVAKIGLPAIYSECRSSEPAGSCIAALTTPMGIAEQPSWLTGFSKVRTPGDTPVQEPTQFLFAVNRGAAQQIDLKIPDSVLLQATEVV